MAISVINNSNMNLTRSLEKILDECSASGELKLSGRKLKDFPRINGKFNLTDTVFAGKERIKWHNLQPNMFFRFTENEAKNKPDA
jgi:hypothetical protein